ncbi:MAG: uroporphyrinogen-III synthase [Helicobacteraceae bacterium]|jgi:uroporphyrinogen-III synthase|nr:uroporphyrinogen-III synthase [Helicobacteraceae bacterium]
MTARPVVTLSLEGVKGAIHLPAIETVFLDAAIDASDFDAVIFTSKQAVKALVRLNGECKSLKVFSIGAATSRLATKLGYAVCLESPKPSANRLAEAIAERYRDLRFCYPRAREVIGELERILKREGVVCQSFVVYETRSKAIDANLIPNDAAIVFSSPSAVKSFFSQTKWRSDWRAVALGQSAAKTLKPFAPYQISPKTDIDAAVAFAASLK